MMQCNRILPFCALFFTYSSVILLFVCATKFVLETELIKWQLRCISIFISSQANKFAKTNKKRPFTIMNNCEIMSQGFLFCLKNFYAIKES